MRAVNSSAPESPCARAPLTKERAHIATPAFRNSILCAQLVYDVFAIGQCIANNRKRMAAASPARSNPAKTRKSKEEGTVGMGPGGLLGGMGGSRTPIPARLRGGPPPRAEEACGSS